MDIKLYPYGNAHEKKLPNGHYAYTCQHGDLECKGNFIEACIQQETDFNADVYFPVLECMESSDKPLTVAKQCLEQLWRQNYMPVQGAANVLVRLSEAVQSLTVASQKFYLIPK